MSSKDFVADRIVDMDSTETNSLSAEDALATAWHNSYIFMDEETEIGSW